MDCENSNWVCDGICLSPHLLGVLVLALTAALVCLSTSYHGGVISTPAATRILREGKREKKHIRVFIDGCFDLMHYGHANALRQAKALGDQLIVGVISDDGVAANKGPPVFSIEERLALVNGLKWVDQVIPNIPYTLTDELMKSLMSEHRIDYIVHGDDPCILPDGTDAYALAKNAGRYRQIKRTEGVSSTDIVGRILATFKDDSVSEGSIDSLRLNARVFEHKDIPKKIHSKAAPVSNFLPTSRRIVQFSNGKAPEPNARVVYIDGAFDLFHLGHVEILKIARRLGDFLLVGIYADETVRKIRGNQYPLMNLHERTLSVLACRYVDEVIIGAPWEMTKDMITTFNISLIVHGTVSEPNPLSEELIDPYALPKRMGMFRMIDSPKDLTTTSVARRIFSNHEAYKRRNAEKVKSEQKYYERKAFVTGD